MALVSVIVTKRVNFTPDANDPVSSRVDYINTEYIANMYERTSGGAAIRYNDPARPYAENIETANSASAIAASA